MNILLVYPKCPDSFWSFNHALKFISKKAAVPPLGLLTVSAMLPATWEKKLVDMNVTTLNSGDILWADYVFISKFSNSDTPTVFQRQIDFIQQSGIVAAMVGLLNAPKNTKLYNQLCKAQNKISLSLLKAFLYSVFVIGILNKGRTEYWKLIFWTLINRPKLMVDALTCTVYGYHFRTVYGLR